MVKWFYLWIKNLVKIYFDFDVNVNYENEIDVFFEIFMKLKLMDWIFFN